MVDSHIPPERIMLIMQKDLLSELHLPKLDITSLRNILSQNSGGLPYLLNQNEHISKTTPLYVKGAAESMLSGFAKPDRFLSTPEDNVKTTKRKFICEKSLLRRNNYRNNDLRKPPWPSVVIKEFPIVDSGEIKCVKMCNFDSKIVVSDIKFNDNNKLPVIQSITNQITSKESEALCNYDKHRKEKTEVNYTLNEFSNCSENYLNRKSVSPIDDEVFVIENDKKCKTFSDSQKNSEPDFCVISEVVGSANEGFPRADDPRGVLEETNESQLITPKKTTDITKIKGWRRKQFFVEKPTTIEYYSTTKDSLSLKKRIEVVNSCPVEQEDTGNVENAFVCNSLDEFLDREADLKIEYEIPHLYAEFGIKLTRDDIVSRPNLSEEDINEVGTRYCMPVTLPRDDTDLDSVKEEPGKGMKRSNEDDPKPCKVLKLEENKNQLTKGEHKQVVKLKNVEIKREPNSVELEIVKASELKVINCAINVKLVSKLIALVVYPSPFAPLHPIAQYHLNKLRSYHTKVDENWANFAVSAVLVNDKRCRRRIIPAYCCVKIERTPTSKPSAEDNQEEVEILPAASNYLESTVSQTECLKLKKCRVVLERLDPKKLSDPWCMVHNLYNCAQCGLAKTKSVGSSSQVAKPKERREERLAVEPVIISPRASFDKNVANLLAKKVRLLKYNGDTLTSIDCLKTLTPNTIEFIKLRFIKESFLAGYISIWFLKSLDAATRSRAFLSFSQTPPFPNAVSLKSTAISRVKLPKVLTDIMFPENSLDSNEYAILHCNGEIWEIHGSLNMVVGNNDKNVEQIFTSVELPELEMLQKIAFDVLKVKTVKWWVLDLTQKFKLIELKSEDINTVITRKKFLETITLSLFGFIPLRKDSENRVLGAYIIQRLLPFILIGPYYLLETHDMILKGNSSTVPFMYYGEDNVTTNYPLKFFINSVIKNVERNDKKLEGLWLYDKMVLDKTSYLEVMTTSLEGSPQPRFSSIDIEHGYSLNSLTSSSPSGTTAGIIKRKDGRVELKTVTVYLYFDIFDLGFVEGELQFDNSVIINHPLDRWTKIKSHRIGDLFISLIKRRIDFFPKDLVVKWFISKYREDLRFRRPFNKLLFVGAHVLTKKGIFPLLGMPDSAMEELGLDKKEVRKSISRCQAIREVKELKNLASLLKNKSSKPLKMHEVLDKAISEITWLRKLHEIYRNRKKRIVNRKLALVSYFIKVLNSFRIPLHQKIKKLEGIERLLTKEGGLLTDDFIQKLKSYRIGRLYLKRVENRHLAWARKVSEARQQEEEKINKVKYEKLRQSSASPSSHQQASPPDDSKSTAQILQDRLGGIESAEEPQESILLPLPRTDQCNSFKLTPPGILKSSRKAKEKNVESHFIRVEPIGIKPKNNAAKSNAFLKLTSPELPDNVKVYWRNWNVNKLGVV